MKKTKLAFNLNPYDKIAKMERDACIIISNEKRKKKVDEMMYYTKAVIGYKCSEPAEARYIGRCKYSHNGELIGFHLEPLVKAFKK